MGGVLTIDRGLFLVVLSLVLLVLTCLQARGSIVTRNFAQSRAYSIFFLRTFSEFAGVSLSATIYSTLESIKWAMLCRNDHSRARLVDFLALQKSTTVFGLLSLAGGASTPSFKTRIWSLIRLLLMILVPGISILIMSQVNIGLAFSPVSSSAPYFGYNIQPMNASAALEYTGFTDLLLSWKFEGFLVDPVHSVDLSPQGDRSVICSLNANSESSNCNRTYFLPGELVIIMPELVANASFPDADVVLASDHRGYLLDFYAGTSQFEFDLTQDCRTYTSRFLGVQVGAIRICVGNSSPNELEARLVTCPGPIASQQMCLNDTSWHNNVDWTVHMSVFFQNSAVAYSRTNGTILWHSFKTTSPTPVQVSSLDILQAYDHLFSDTTTWLHNNSTPLPLFSSTIFPGFLWMTEPEFSNQTAVNPATTSHIYSILQALLAVPLYYSQSGVARRLLPPILDSKLVSNPELTILFDMLSAPPQPTSPGAFATHRYEIMASFPTLVGYIVLSGVTLLACVLAHIMISLSGTTRPSLSRFPTLDLFAHCTIEDENRCVMYQGRSGFMPADTSQRSLKSWLSSVSIKWSQPRNTEDGLRLFTDDIGSENMNWSSISMGSVSSLGNSRIRGEGNNCKLSREEQEVFL